MKTAARIAGWLLTLVCLAYVLLFFVRGFDAAALRAIVTWPVAVATLAAALLYAGVVPLSAWAWARLLRRQGEDWSPRMLAGWLARIQLAKYVPGNVLQHISRVALAVGAGMRPRVFLVSVVQETVLVSAASLMVGVAALALSIGLGSLHEESRQIMHVAIMVLGAALVALAAFDVPPDRLTASDSRVIRALGHAGGLPGWRVTVPALLAYAANYLLVGLALWLVGQVAGMPAALTFLVATGAFALSWVLGFLVPGAPAGFGVREAVMLALLAPILSEPDALVFVLLARLVTIVGDLVVFAAWLLASGCSARAAGGGGRSA